MTLRDRFYLRFFLLHRRYGRIWAALMAVLVYFFFIAICVAAMWGAVQLSVWWYESSVVERTKAARQEAATYQNMLLACLNGGVIGKAGDEVVACEPAVTFRMGGVR